MTKSFLLGTLLSGALFLTWCGNYPTHASDSKETSRSKWCGAWGASPVFPMGQEINNQTIRQIVRLSCGGTKLRVRFSNETSTNPLVIGSAHVAIPGPDGSIRAGSDHVLTFNGQPSITVPGGAPALSDPIEMETADLGSIAISMFIPRWTGLAVVHPSGLQTAYISKSGDFCGSEKLEGASTTKFRFFLTEVDVSGTRENHAVVAFGDSITDGYGSTLDGNKRWPDRLAERLSERASGTYGVVDAGLSGNRLLHDAPASMFGPNALARFDRDVLSVPGISHVIILEGINDIGHSTSSGLTEQAVSAEQLKAALAQLFDRAHEHGVKVIAGTLLPYEGTTFANYWNGAGEKKRQEVNAWLRSEADIDGLADFDLALKDPQKPTRMKPEYDCGDHLHPSDAGYRVMADCIDLSLFK